jgi:hypothetical protein
MWRLLSCFAPCLCLLLAACAPSAPTVQEVLPTFVAPPEITLPPPNEAYPTARAAESNASQTVSGFSLRMEQAWREGKEVHADVCFSLPDSSNWTIWDAHFEYGAETVSEFSSSLLSKDSSTGGREPERCDELAFYVPPDADVSSSTITVESVGAYPTPDEYCSLYMPKIQQSLQERGIAITLDCPEVNGVKNLEIASKPDDMSQTEAEQLVFSDQFYTVKGPWTFPITFAP